MEKVDDLLHVPEYELKEVYLVDDPPRQNVKLSDLIRSIVKEVLEEMGYSVPKK